MTRKYFVVPLFIISSILLGCRNTDVSSIPDVPVYLNLNLTINYNTFRAPLQYLTFEKRNDAVGAYNVGYGGVLVNINVESKYCAFDMACPYEKDKKIKVRPDQTGGFAVCEQCGSKFDLVYGYGQVTQGPSKESLKRYSTNAWINGGIQMLRISR